MSKIKLLSIAVIGLLVVNIAVVGFLLLRKPPHPSERRFFGQDGPKNIIIAQLHFDQGQVTEYEKLIDQHQSSIKSLEDSISLVKNNLYLTLNNESITVKDSLITRLGILQKQIELIHYDHFAAIRKICKPAQLKYFNDLTYELAHFFAPGKKDMPPPKD